MNYNPYSLEGKTILVTGASSGIGKAIAIECSKAGATLIIVARRKEKLIETLQYLDNTKDNKVISLDLSTQENIDNLVSQIDKIDGLVLAAGIVEMWPVLFATREKFESMFNTNFFSPVEILRSIVKKKSYNKNLSVVVIGSVAGKNDFCVTNGIYGSGKAALSTFMKYAALELAPKKIRINTISPGMILTPMHGDGRVEKEKLEETVAKVPLKRWGEPEDVAFAAIYLLSNAASYVTGTDICIDGGYTI